MPQVVGTSSDRRVDAEALEAFVAGLFTAAGTSDADAALIARLAVGTDLRGAYSHGTALVPMYVGLMLAGKVDPRGRPSVTRDTGAAIKVDGNNSLGHVGLTFATERAIERATDIGMAAVALSGSNHCGAMWPYALQARDHDMIVLATTNGLPTMAWYGGIDRIVSINPVGIYIPAGEERPVLIDTSFGAAARGKILVHKQKGLPLPEGWAFDQDGNPTIDPEAALNGLIQPAGGYKGTSMALLMGVLASLLSGGAYGTELGNFVSGPAPGQDAQFVMALNVGAFEDPDVFKSRMDGVIRQIKASRPAPGVDRVLLPGERAAETEASYRRDGVPLTDATRDGLIAVAEQAGVDSALVQSAEATQT